MQDINTLFNIITRALVASAHLSYDGKYIRFDDDILETAFKLLLPDVYDETLEKLKAEKDGAE